MFQQNKKPALNWLHNKLQFFFPSLNNDLSKVRTYVGSDGKLHFTNSAGADTVLPFSKADYCSGEVHESGKWGTQTVNLAISDYTKLDFVLMGRYYRYFFKYDALKNIKTEVLSGAPPDAVTIGSNFFSIFYNTGNKWNCGDGSGTLYYWASK